MARTPLSASAAERGNARHDPLGRGEARRACLEHDTPALATREDLSHDGKQGRAVDAVGSLVAVQHGPSWPPSRTEKRGAGCRCVIAATASGNLKGAYTNPRSAERCRSRPPSGSDAPYTGISNANASACGARRVTTQPDTSDQHDAPAVTRPLDAVQPRRVGSEIEAECLPQVLRFRLEVGDRVMVGALTCGPDLVGRRSPAHAARATCATRSSWRTRGVKPMPTIPGAVSRSARPLAYACQRPRVERRCGACECGGAPKDVLIARQLLLQPRGGVVGLMDEALFGAPAHRRGRRDTSRAGTSAARRSAPPTAWRGAAPRGPARRATRDRGLALALMA